MSVQFIKSARAGKPVTWYIYAWRGGPLIRKVQQPRKPMLTPADHAAIGMAAVDDRAIKPELFRWIIRQWCPVDPATEATKGSPEWRALAKGTKDTWRRYVDAIETRWGKYPSNIWNDPRMVAKVIKWRDERAATPRAADIGVTVLCALLEFARLRGWVKINVARGIPRLYKGGERAEIIWTAADIAAFEAKAIDEEKVHALDGLRLAACTGLRRQDLVTLTWDQIGEFAIVKTALKRSKGKRRRVTIPHTPQLAKLLEELRSRKRKEGVDTVLVNSRGTPWTGWGFSHVFNEIRDLVGIAHVDLDPDGEERRRTKHLHDVRGTFCTMLLAEWDLTDKEAAEIMGWSVDRVANIRKVYVDDLRVVVALAERIAAKQVAKQSSGTGKKT